MMAQKLLVIDDQKGVARVVGLVGAELGYETRIETRPEEAAETFITFQPDVVVLDMIMPEKDGIDVLQELLVVGSAFRLVLTSGFSTGYLQLAEQVARMHGMTGVTVLRKPFRRDDLRSALRPEWPVIPAEPRSAVPAGWHRLAAV